MGSKKIYIYTVFLQEILLKIYMHVKFQKLCIQYVHLNSECEN